MNQSDRAHEQCLAKLNKDSNGVVRTTSRIEDADQDNTNKAIPRRTKKSGLKRGEGWAKEVLDCFQDLLDMVRNEDRSVDGSRVVEDQLLKFWSKMEKGKKKEKEKKD